MADNVRKPARLVHPGVLVHRILLVKAMDQIEGIDRDALWELVEGSGRITPEIADVFAKAFGTSAQLWLNLQANYDMHSED